MRHAGTAQQARSHDVDRFESGALEAWGGIVSGRVTEFAEALDTDPETVLQAAKRVPLLVDTAEPKGRRGEPDRPDGPELRCLAHS